MLPQMNFSSGISGKLMPSGTKSEIYKNIMKNV